MNGPSSQVLAHAAAVVARCLEGGRGPADAMSAMPALRAAGGPVRAEVSRWARRAIAGRLRFEYLLRDRLAARSADRARLLLCAAVIEAGLDVPPGEALPSRARMQAVLEQIEEPVERLAVRAAVPRWLAERFAQTFGDEAEAVLDGLAQEAPRTVRANLLRGSRDELQARLRAEGIRTVPGRFAPTALHCEGTADLFATQAFRDGWFEQQDEASQLCVTATAPPPRGRVLDLCCGSGGKTLGLAAALRNRGAVLATDVHAGRLEELRARLPRAGADNVRPHLLEADDDGGPVVAGFAGRCDRILIDAPCSGTGSWRRRPEARAATDEHGLAAMVATQRSLLRRAAAWLRPGARLVYATCSLLPEENERQVEWLLEQMPGLERVRLAEVLGGATAGPIADPSGTYLQVRPDRHGCDGFFAAIVRRARASEADYRS